MNRKLIRPNLTEIKERMSQDKEREKEAAHKRMHPPTDTFAESYYFLKQMNKKTPMAVVYTDGQIVEGYIEWYDRNCIKLNRDNAPNLLIYKSSIRCIYKVDEVPEPEGEPAGREMTVPTIGVTPGDPGGIGPEVVVKTLARAAALPAAAYVLFADPRVIEAEERAARAPARAPRLAARPVPPSPGCSSRPSPARPDRRRPAQVSAENGEASFRCLRSGRGRGPRRPARGRGHRADLEGGLGPGRASLPRPHGLPGRALSRGHHDLLVGAAQGRPLQPSPASPRGRRGGPQGRAPRFFPVPPAGPSRRCPAGRSACSRPA